MQLRMPLLVLCCLFMFSSTQTVCAQGMGARMLSRMTTKAISKNVTFAFKPRLKVTKNQLGAVTTGALSKDQNLLVIGMDDGSIRAWDLLNGQQWAAYSDEKTRNINCVAASSESGLIVSTDDHGGLILHKPGAKSERQSAGSPVLALDFIAPQQIVGATQSGNLFLWKTDSNQLTILHRGEISLEQAAISDAVFVTLDSKGIVTSIDMASLMDGRYATKVLRKNVRQMAVSRDGSVTYVQTGKKELLALRTRSALTLATFKSRKTLERLAASSKGCAAIDSGDNLNFFSLKNKKARKVGELEKSPSALLVDDAGNYLMTGFAEGVLQLWSVPGRERLANLISTRKGWAVIDEDGRFAGTETGLTDIAWAGEDNAPIPVGNVSSNYYDPGLLPKVMGGEQLASVDSISDGLTLPPKVEIEAQSGSSLATVTVRGIENKGGGVSDLRLYQNGKRVSETRLVESSAVDGKGRKLEIKKVYSVPVLSQNRLSAVALNNDMVESAPTQLVLNSKKKQSSIPQTLHVVTIGINDYDDPALTLVSAASDADGIDGLFAKSNNVFSARKHYALRDKEVTRQSLEAQLTALRDVAVQDAVLIYLTGHGLAYEDEWYFLPRNIELDKLPGDLKSAGVSAAMLQEMLTEIPADQILLVIDSCQAGGVLPPAHRFAGLHALRTMSRLSGIHILAATNKEQDALEVDALGHGLLTYSVLQGIQGHADLLPKDRNISVREVMDYSVKVVPILSNKYGGYKQYPTVFSRGYDFYLVSQ